MRVKSIARRSKENRDARIIRRSAFILAVLLVGPRLASAQKLDKDDKKFLDDVRPILLSEEEKIYKGLKEKSDRLEFQKIFWARRDPDLATPANEYQAEYEKARAEADRLYRLPASPAHSPTADASSSCSASPTRCSRRAGRWRRACGVPRSGPTGTGRGGRSRAARRRWPSTPNAGRRAASRPQMDRSRGAGGAAEHRLPVGQGRQAGEARGPAAEGHAGAGTRSSSRARTSRRPCRPAYLKIADGGDRAPSGSSAARRGPWPRATSGGTKSPEESPSSASAVGEDGKEAGWTEQAMSVPVEADGSFVAGFKLALRPGKYTLNAGVVDEKGPKGSLASMPIEVPDLAKVESGADGSVEQAAHGRVAAHRQAHRGGCRAAYRIAGGARSRPSSLGPRASCRPSGASRAPSEQVEFVYQVYDLRTPTRRPARPTRAPSSAS